MICELCGKKTNKLYTIYIEGTYMKVCEDCKKYGKEINEEKPTINKNFVEKNIDIIDEVYEDVGKILREYRSKNNLKQEDMAKLLGIKLSLYKSIEENRIRPNKEIIEKIEKKLKVNLRKKEVIFEKKEENKKSNLTVGDVIIFEDEE